MLFWIARAIIKVLAVVVWRARATGTENIPLDGPLIVACNHRSYLDPPVMGCFVPRKISYMAKRELFEIPILGAGIRAVGAYPVDREGSATAAIKRSLEVLRAGGCVGIFPEGGRNVDGEKEPRAGVALLASLAKAPVVPAAIVGGDHAKHLGAIKVAFGKPLSLPSDRKATRDDLAKFTEETMSAIGGLLREIGGDSQG
jgi:1-acyl-sn-glycerol-3-phosphate acyltransferase